MGEPVLEVEALVEVDKVTAEEEMAEEETAAEGLEWCMHRTSVLGREQELLLLKEPQQRGTRRET